MCLFIASYPARDVFDKIGLKKRWSPAGDLLAKGLEIYLFVASISSERCANNRLENAIAIGLKMGCLSSERCVDPRPRNMSVCSPISSERCVDPRSRNVSVCSPISSERCVWQNRPENAMISCGRFAGRIVGLWVSVSYDPAPVSDACAHAGNTCLREHYMYRSHIISWLFIRILLT